MPAQDFATFMRNFAGSQTTTPGVAGYYQPSVHQPLGNENCFAYAVGRATPITAQTREQLSDAYDRERFYEIPMTTPRRAGDAEIYARPSEATQITHAHRVTGATTATSKLGSTGELIDHHIDTLQARKPPGVGGPTHEYGQLIMRFRRDDAKFNRRWQPTRSGRLVRKRDDEDDPEGKKKQKPQPKPAPPNPSKPAPPATKTPATKTPATKTPTPTTKAPVTKTPTPAPKAPAPKAPAPKAPAPKAPAPKAPAPKAPAVKVPAPKLRR